MDALKGPELIGWVSSIFLLLTIFKQIHKQWKEHSSKGVSKWLYLGQILAEVGFITYSAILRNWVFLVTNIALLLSNFVGLGIVFHHRRQAKSLIEQGASPEEAKKIA